MEKNTDGHPAPRRRSGRIVQRDEEVAVALTQARSRSVSAIRRGGSRDNRGDRDDHHRIVHNSVSVESTNSSGSDDAMVPQELSSIHGIGEAVVTTADKLGDRDTRERSKEWGNVEAEILRGDHTTTKSKLNKQNITRAQPLTAGREGNTTVNVAGSIDTRINPRHPTVARPALTSNVAGQLNEDTQTSLGISECAINEAAATRTVAAATTDAIQLTDQHLNSKDGRNCAPNDTFDNSPGFHSIVAAANAAVRTAVANTSATQYIEQEQSLVEGREQVSYLDVYGAASNRAVASRSEDENAAVVGVVDNIRSQNSDTCLLNEKHLDEASPPLVVPELYHKEPHRSIKVLRSKAQKQRGTNRELAIEQLHYITSMIEDHTFNNRLQTLRLWTALESFRPHVHFLSHDRLCTFLKLSSSCQIKLASRRSGDRVCDLQSRVGDGLLQWLSDIQMDIELDREITMEEATLDESTLKDITVGLLPEPEDITFVEDYIGATKELFVRYRLLWLTEGDWLPFSARLGKAVHLTSLVAHWESFSIQEWQRVFVYFRLKGRHESTKQQMAVAFAGFAESWVQEHLSELSPHLQHIGHTFIGQVLSFIPREAIFTSWGEVMDTYNWTALEERAEVVSWLDHPALAGVMDRFTPPSSADKEPRIHSMQTRTLPTVLTLAPTPTPAQHSRHITPVPQAQIQAEHRPPPSESLYQHHTNQPEDADEFIINSEQMEILSDSDAAPSTPRRPANSVHNIQQIQQVTSHSHLSILMQTQKQTLANQSTLLEMITNLCGSIQRANSPSSEVHALATGCSAMVGIIHSQQTVMQALFAALPQDTNIAGSQQQQQLPRIRPQQVRNLAPRIKPSPTLNEQDFPPLQSGGQPPPQRSWTQVAAKKKSSTSPPKLRQPTKSQKRQHEADLIKTKAMELKQSKRNDSRTLKFTPQDNTIRTMNIGFCTFATTIEEAIAKEVSDTPYRPTEDVRRDGRGAFYIQFSDTMWNHLNSSWDLDTINRTINLRAYGVWDITTSSPSPLTNMTPIVVTGVRLDMPSENILKELVMSNSDLNLDVSMIPSKIRQATRLTRWNNNTTITDPNRKRVPCTSVLFWTAPDIAKTILERQLVSFEYRILSVHQYNRPVIKCLQCGMKGSHLARDCRNPAKCRVCGDAHDTQACTKKPVAPTKRVVVADPNPTPAGTITISPNPFVVLDSEPEDDMEDDTSITDELVTNVTNERNTLTRQEKT